jgi:hypothetical protein
MSKGEHRSRNEDGRLRAIRSDMHVGNLEQRYGMDFGVRSDMHVGTLLTTRGLPSVSALLRSDIVKTP